MTYQSERLSEEHDLRPFESSEPDLDRWLKESALRAQKQPAGRTYVWHEGDKVVVAHFTLLGHVLSRGVLPRKEQRSVPHEVPAILLAKLALDKRLHGQRLGRQLLADAMIRCIEAGRIVAFRYVVVDAISENAAGFYQRFGFIPIPDTSPVRLIRKLADIEQAHRLAEF